MMSRLRTVVGVCIVACAFGAVTVTGASATEFVFSKTGTLKGSALAVHTWFFGFETSCGKEKVSGTVTALKTTKQKITVQYEECANSFVGGLTATPAEMELNTNGSVKILKEFKLANGICNFGEPVQTKSTDTYSNKPAGKIEIVEELLEFVTTGKEPFCEIGETTSPFGGKTQLELTGGTAEVK
jgi:hypothetical protein